jgi:site-specific DNA-methyltransferase (adenine-specific)
MRLIHTASGCDYFIGDGVEFCRSLPPHFAHHVITDPPYTEHVQGNMQTVHTVHKRNQTGKISGKVTADFAHAEGSEGAILASIAHVASRWTVIHCALEQLAAWGQRSGAPDAWIRSAVYVKIRCTPQLTADRPGSAAEGIALRHADATKLRWNNGGRGNLFVSMPENRKDTGHDTAKPITLMLQILQAFTDPNDLIIDPFAGTGATLIAAEILGRKCIAIELDPQYAERFTTRRANALRHADQLLATAARYAETKRTDLL